MIPARYIDYLKSESVPFLRRSHERAVGGQAVAEALRVSGWRVAKTVLVEADGQRWMVVLPVPERLNLTRLRTVLAADQVHLLDERALAAAFPDCELGAEPPFASLYGLPVLLDRRLTDAGVMVVRAGSHEECLTIPVDDYVRVERPRIAHVGELIGRPRTTEARV